MNGVALLPVLLCLSAFFSASETALFSLDRADLAKLRTSRSRAATNVLALLAHPGKLLVAVLFGNLIVNFLLFAVSAHVIAGMGQWAGPASYVLGAMLTTGVVIVFGEVGPKSLAVTRPVPIALWTATPLHVFGTIARKLGLTTPLERIVEALLWVIEGRLPRRQGTLTDDELRRFVAIQGERGLIERRASEFLAEALDLRSRRAHEVMTPRVDLVACDLHAGREAFMDLVRRHRVGKVLVHEGEGLDKVSGFLRTRDVFAQPETPLAELIQPCWFVPHTKSLEALLREMIDRGEPLGLVVGEYGGTAGVITLEDIVEEITGDIARDDAPALLSRLDNGTWAISGRFPLREVGELLGLGLLDAGGGATTLAGFVSQTLDRIPEVGDVVWHAGVQFRVDAVDRRRASRVRIALPGSVPDRPQQEDPPDAMTVSGAHRANDRLTRWIAESAPEQEDVR